MLQAVLYRGMNNMKETMIQVTERGSLSRFVTPLKQHNSLQPNSKCH